MNIRLLMNVSLIAASLLCAPPAALEASQTPKAKKFKNQTEKIVIKDATLFLQGCIKRWSKSQYIPDDIINVIVLYYAIAKRVIDRSLKELLDRHLDGKVLANLFPYEGELWTINCTFIFFQNGYLLTKDRDISPYIISDNTYKKIFKDATFDPCCMLIERITMLFRSIERRTEEFLHNGQQIRLIKRALYDENAKKAESLDDIKAITTQEAENNIYKGGEFGLDMLFIFDLVAKRQNEIASDEDEDDDEQGTSDQSILQSSTLGQIALGAVAASTAIIKK